MNFLVKLALANKNKLIVFFILLFFFSDNLWAQNKIGLCFTTPKTIKDTQINNLSFTVTNPISGATEYIWNAGSSFPNTAITSGGTVSVDASGNITIINSYKLVPAADGTFSETTVTYTLKASKGTSGETTVEVILIPKPQIKSTTSGGPFVNVCSNKIFSLPLEIENKISVTYGYTWTASSPAIGQLTPVLASSGTQNLYGNGRITYNISATIDTVQTGSKYKGYSFPNFSTCVSTINFPYVVYLGLPPQKPDIGANKNVCFSSIKDAITLSNSKVTSGLSNGWYQLSGKTKLSFTNPNSAATQVSGFVGADTSRGPLAEEYQIVCYETNAGCDTLRDTISIFVWQKPIAKITSPNPSYFCNADKIQSTITVKATNPHSYGTWTILGTSPVPAIISGSTSDSIIQLKNSLLSTTGAIDSLEYSCIWQVQNAHCDASSGTVVDSIKIIAIHSPSTATVVSSKIKVCDNSTIDLFARKPQFGKGSWSFVKTLMGTGTPSFTNKTDTVITVTLPSVSKDSNVYIFSWKVQSGSCTDFSIAYDTVYVYAKDNANITNPDTIWVCSNAMSTITLNATALKSASGVWTLISKPAGVVNPSMGTATNSSISISNITAPSANKPDTNMYVFTWSIKGTNIGLCGTTKTTDTVRIAVVNPPSLAEIKDGTPDTFYVCGTTNPTISIKATSPTIGKGKWTWSLISGTGTIIITDPNNPQLNATVEIPSTIGSSIVYKLTWSVNNGNACGSNMKSIIIYGVNADFKAATGKLDTNMVCATTKPQNVYLQTSVQGDVVWNQLPAPYSDSMLPGFPNINRFFTISVNPPQGSAVGRYTFTIGSSSGKCVSLKKDTLLVLVNNLSTVPNFTPGSKYSDTNYVCHVDGKNDTLLGLSMRYDASTIGKGLWTQTNNFLLPDIDWYNLLTSKPDTMGSINLVVTNNNVNKLGTGLATYNLQWTVTSGACPPTSKSVVFVISNNSVQGVANIINKGTNGIRWLCGTGITRDTILKVTSLPTGWTGIWTQIKTAPYNNTPIVIVPSSSGTEFTLQGLPAVNNKPDTMKFAFVWNVQLNGKTCVQTSGDTIKIYIVSRPPSIPKIQDFPVCGNSGSKISMLITVPKPAFGQGFWSAISNDIVVTPMPPISAIVDSLPSPGTKTVQWNLKNAECPIIDTQRVDINVSDGAKAQVKEKIKYVCNDNYTLTITNNKITKAETRLTIAATTIKSGTGKWTVVPSVDGVLTIPAGTETNTIISPTLTIQGNSLAKDSTIYKLYWTTNSVECGITIDSTLVVAYPPLSDSITNGYNVCFAGAPNSNLSTTLFGPYIAGKSGTWAQDTTKKIVGNLIWNKDAVVITNTPTSKSDSVKISNLIVPNGDTINIYGIRRIVPATYSCPAHSKMDTIRVYQQSSAAKVLSKDTIHLCSAGGDIDTILKANKPNIGKGFWKLISQTNKSSNITTSFINDTTTQVHIKQNDSCIYRFRWSTFISTFCNDTLIGSSFKDIYIVVAGSLANKVAQITQIDGIAIQDTNWVCQKATVQLTNDPYSVGKGSWRVINRSNPLKVTFSAVAGATTTKVNIANLSLPALNDTSKYLIEFSIANGICDTSRDSILIFVLNNPSTAQLSAIPANPQSFCDISTVPNPPNDSTVVKPQIGVGSWTKKDSIVGIGSNLGIDTIRWTWTVSNRCKTTSVQRTYIIANNAQGTAKILNKSFPTGRDTLIICLPVSGDTTLNFSGNPPPAGTGQWTQFLGTSLSFTSLSKPSISPATQDTIVSIKGFSGTDSMRVYGVIWSISKSSFCPPSYDSAYVKVFRKPPKPIFTPDSTMTCIQPNLPVGRDTVLFTISPSNLSKYTFGKFEWSIVRNKQSFPASAYIYILRPTESQKTVKIVLKNANTLKDTFKYIIRLKVSGGGNCGADSTDYKIIVYPAIVNKNAFGFNPTKSDSAKIIRFCGLPKDNIYLANRTLQSYQKGAWKIIQNPASACLQRNPNPCTSQDTGYQTNITNMGIPAGQSMAIYLTEFTISNRNASLPSTCSAKDTISVIMLDTFTTPSPGILIKSDSVCYGTVGKNLILDKPKGVISFDWQIADAGKNNWTNIFPKPTILTYILPEIIAENDYRVKVYYQIPTGGTTKILTIGNCPMPTQINDSSNVVQIRLKNKDNYRLGKILPDTQYICAENIFSLQINGKTAPSELSGHTVRKWQSYQTAAYGKGATLPNNNPWVNETTITTFDYTKKASNTSTTTFYRAWIRDIDTAKCDFVTDTAVVYVKPKPKMSGAPKPICADNNFNFRFDSITEGYNTGNYPSPFTTAIKQITWHLANTASAHSRTGMTAENGILPKFSTPIQYIGRNNDTLPLVDTVVAYATGIMGCESKIDTITFTVYPTAKAQLINKSPLVNCPPIYVDSFIKLRDYKTLNSGYSWIVKNDVGVGTWTSNGTLPPHLETNYAQNLAIQLTASSKYNDSATGKPCPSNTIYDTLYSFGKITPNITISNIVCYGTPISFTNTSSVNTLPKLNDTLIYRWWDSKDSLLSTEIFPTDPFIPANIYPYKDSIYTIKYEISNKCYSVLNNKGVYIQSIPKAELNVNLDSFCSGTTINIWKTNELGNNPNQYKNEWLFGDGNSFSTSTYPFVADINNPIKHKYDSIRYSVDTLMQIISNNCGTDTQTHLIRILPVPKPAINLTFNDTICGSSNKYSILDKTFFGGKEPVSATWYINDSLVQKIDNLYAVTDTLLTDTLWHSFSQYVNKNFPDQVKPIGIKLSIKPTLGCEADTTNYILVGSTAQPEIFIDTIQPCPPADFNILATAAAGINKWTWSVNNSPINVNSSNIPSIQFQSGVYKVKVIVSSVKQVCPIDSAFKTFVVYGYPKSQFELLNTQPYCYTPFPAHYQSTSIDADAKMMPISNWFWQIDSATSAPTYPKDIENKDFIYTYLLGGEYKTKHWVEDSRGRFHCVSDTISRNYTILGRSNSKFNMVDTTCATYIVSFNNKTTLGYGSSLIDSSYWIMGDGSEMKKYSGDKSITYSFDKGGVYNISLLTKGNLGVCVFDTLTKTIVVRGFPKANFDIISPCSGNYSTFNNLSTPGFSDGLLGYKWTFEDGQISNTKNPSKLYDVPGTYSATLTANGLLCPLKSDTTISFVIQPAAKAILFPTVYVGVGIPFDLVAPSDNNTYQWLDNNKIPVNPSEPNTQIITSTLPALMKDTFYLRSTLGNCIVDNVQIVQALPKLDVVAPSGFTPNGDGINDFFVPKYVGIKQLTYFQIFDRFGQLLFSTTDTKQHWDGTFKGKPLPTATYIWVVSGVDDLGKPVKASGGITLIRDNRF